jgi:hypothetical protein
LSVFVNAERNHEDKLRPHSRVYVTYTGLKLRILLPQPPKFWITVMYHHTTTTPSATTPSSPQSKAEFFFFLVVVEFKLRVSYLLHRHPTT